MGIKAVLETIDGIDENVRGLYKEVDGKFVLDVEPVDDYALENIGGLKKVNSDLASDRDQLRGKLRESESTMNALKLQIAELEAGKSGELDQRISKLKNDLTELHQKELKSRDDTVETLRGQLRNLSVTNALKDALVSHKATENGVKLLPDILGKNIKLDDSGNPIVVDQNGNVRSGKSGNMTIQELVGEQAQTLPEFFMSDAKSGGGTKNSSGTPGSSGGKTKTRSEYEQLSPKDRIEFTKGGGKVVD